MLKIKKIFNIRVLVLIIFIVIAYALKKTMFIQGDGFNSQVISVMKGAQYGLSKVHTIRFLVVSPFYFLGKNNSIIQAILMYIYARPILKNQTFKAYILIMVVLLLFSYRTSIVALSLPYFHLYQKTNKKRYFIFSFLFSILSSATVLNFIAIYLLYNYKKIYKKLIYVLILFIAFLPSFKHKIIFFTAGGSGYFQTMIQRSFIIEAILTKNYIRIMLGVFCILIFLAQIFMCLKNGKIKIRNIEKIFLVIFLFMEGLGVYSYLIENVIIFDKLFKIKKKKVVKE